MNNIQLTDVAAKSLELNGRSLIFSTVLLIYHTLDTGHNCGPRTNETQVANARFNRDGTKRF